MKNHERLFPLSLSLSAVRNKALCCLFETPPPTPQSIIQHIELCHGAKQPLFTLDQSPSTELEDGAQRGEARKTRAKSFSFETMTSTFFMPCHALVRDERI